MSIAEAHALKTLQTKAEELRQEKSALIKKSSEIAEQIRIAGERLRKVEFEIQRITERNRSPVVSEHALLRYLERIEGVDMRAVEQKILTPQVLQSIKALGSGKHPSGTGFRAVVRGTTVTTVEAG